MVSFAALKLEDATALVCIQHCRSHYLLSTVRLQISSSVRQCSSREVHTQCPTLFLLLNDPTKREEKVKNNISVCLHIEQVLTQCQAAAPFAQFTSQLSHVL